jgi:hypothetical protein
MDRDIVVRARTGDRDASSMLATASIRRLNAVARLIVRDDGRAEDAVQDALVDASLDLPALRGPDRFVYHVDLSLAEAASTMGVGQNEMAGRAVWARPPSSRRYTRRVVEPQEATPWQSPT